MRVAMYYNNRDVRLEELPAPQIGAGEVLVRIVASGICGSDVMEWYRIKKAPLVLGHEIAGDITEVGDGVKRYAVGDRVVVSHHVPCNTCRDCLRGNHTVCRTLRTTNFDPGGFCEYVRVPPLQVDRGILVLPDEVSFDAGTFVEPLGCAVRGQRLANLRPGDSVLILGSGVSGLLHLLLAKTAGAGRIITTDVDPERWQLAAELGADATVDAKDDVPARIREHNDGRLADQVIVCTGATPAFSQALASVERGGKVLFYAPPDPDLQLPLPANDFWSKAVTLLSTYAAAPADLATALELIRAGRVPVEPLITHRLPLAEAARGFGLMAGLEQDRSLKVILLPQQ